MKKSLSCCLSIACLTLLCLPHSAVADDLTPAPFRDEPNSVLAKFDLMGQPNLDTFSEGANPTYPLSTIPTTITQDPTGAPFYQVELPNYIDDLPLKLMRIQYSWFGQGGDAQTATINVSPNVGGTIDLVDASPIMPVPGVSNAFHRYDDFEIRPNPDFEAIQVEFFNADPRWLIFDTISTVPEPSSLAIGMLAMASLAIRRRR